MALCPASSSSAGAWLGREGGHGLAPWPGRSAWSSPTEKTNAPRSAGAGAAAELVGRECGVRRGAADPVARQGRLRRRRRAAPGSTAPWSSGPRCRAAAKNGKPPSADLDLLEGLEQQRLSRCLAVGREALGGHAGAVGVRPDEGVRVGRRARRRWCWSGSSSTSRWRTAGRSARRCWPSTERLGHPGAGERGQGHTLAERSVEGRVERAEQPSVGARGPRRGEQPGDQVVLAAPCRRRPAGSARR